MLKFGGLGAWFVNFAFRGVMQSERGTCLYVGAAFKQSHFNSLVSHSVGRCEKS